MKLSPGTRYAVRLLFELDGAGRPLPIASLADKTGLSFRVVENVHAVLKRNGITGAVIGAKGGVVLQVPLTEISLGRVVSMFEDGVEFAVCCGEKAYDCPQQNDCATRNVWRRVSERIQRALDAVPLADIIRLRGALAESADIFEEEPESLLSGGEVDFVGVAGCLQQTSLSLRSHRVG